MLDVGLIGLGPDWESRYRPVLERLRRRLRVRAVYSAVAIRAEPAAEEFECSVSHGFLALMRRPDIRAVLLLDSAWIDPAILIRAACEQAKPIYLGRPYGTTALLSPDLLRLGSEGLVTPELAHRYTPATSRLRELMASRLGRPLEIRIVGPDLAPHREAPGPAQVARILSDPERDFLRPFLDWCTHLVGTPPVSIAAASEHDRNRICLGVEFRQPAKGGEATRAHFEISPQSSGNSGTEPEYDLSCVVRCAAGTAEIQGRHTVSWEHQGKMHLESLAAERDEIEVLLDHFCRRVVGGLIPVPTLDDLFAAERLCDAAQLSLNAGKPTRLGGGE